MVLRRHWLWPRVILAHLPIRPPENITKFRSFVLLLEACFFCMFWSMRSKEKMYEFPERLWLPSSFEWGGLMFSSPSHGGNPG